MHAWKNPCYFLFKNALDYINEIFDVKVVPNGVSTTIYSYVFSGTGLFEKMVKQWLVCF